MSARKLGRLAGLVFALAAFLGGVGSAAQDAPRADVAAAPMTPQVIDWG